MRRKTRVFRYKKRGVRGETEKLSLEPTTVGRIMLITLLTLLAAGVSLAFAVGGEEELVTLPFGDGVGDHFGPYALDAVSNEIPLDGKYIFYAKEQTSLFISENGIISFERPFPDPFPRALPLTSSPGTSTPPPLIAGFWGDINVPKNGGAIFFIEMNERINGRFGRARAHVLNLLREGFGRSMEDFYPTHIFLCTWESVHENNPGVAKRAVTFQIVLVTDSERTYALLLYSDVRWDMSNGHGVLVGFNAGDGVRSYTHPFSNISILDLDFSTNARTLGAHVYRVDKNETIDEPTDAQKSESICVLSFDGSREAGKEYKCDCPTEERPLLSFNQINCREKPLAIEFINDTPQVLGNSIRALFRASRPGTDIYCHIPKIDRQTKQDCSSGVFVRRNLPKGKYSLRIVASDPLTREKAVLRAEYFIPSLSATREDPHCGATVVNMSSELKNGRFEIEFRGTPHVGSFICRIDGGTNEPCTSPYAVEGQSAGRHRLVVVPVGPVCVRGNTKAASYRFTVQS